jgi:riboflavin kinase/FMN adenylyltransferase
MKDDPAPVIPVYRSLQEIPAGFGPCVAVIGNFDGVHLGHREILSAVVAEARALGVHSVAVTFDPHPEQFLRPQNALKLLTPMSERLRLLAATGIDAVLVLPFDAALAMLPAREFVGRILVERSASAACMRAATSALAHRALAGVEKLKEFGASSDLPCMCIPRCGCTGLRFRVRRFGSWWPRATCAARAGCWGGLLRSVQPRPGGAGSARACVVPTVNLAPYNDCCPPSVFTSRG